jgi:methylmalonyl-CoA/ethylmalonyl-CoA epimerase
MLAKCRAAGVTLVDELPRIGAEGKRIAFLHPRSTGGILIELSEI